MINQPFGMPPKWFTFMTTKSVAWNPQNEKEPPRFSSTQTSRRTVEVKYIDFSPNEEETIDLRNVTGWKTVPNDEKSHTFELETIEVFLSHGRKVIKLHNQKDNPQVKLSKWDTVNRASDPMKKVTIPQPKITQIDDFFDAMLAAKLL